MLHIEFTGKTVREHVTMTINAGNPGNAPVSTPVVISYDQQLQRGNAWTQTWALFVDSYRDINAKKLFWIVMALSVFVVAAFALLGINDRGVTLFKMQFDSIFNTTLISRGEFYKALYVQFAIPIWLAWIATILALVSTAGVFPEMLTSGAIDLYLSKPIGRLRLFLTKYLAALLFVALQALGFSFASFLLIGIRGGEWEPGLFLTVPIIVIFFSYLYGICALLGVITRSTVAALLLTLLIWVLFWGVQTAQQTVHLFRVAGEVQQEDYAKLIAFHEDQIKMQSARPPTTQTATAISTNEFQLKLKQQLKDDAKSTLGNLTLADNIISACATVFPKTGKTIELLSRELVKIAHLEREHAGDHRNRRGGKTDENEVPMAVNDPRVIKRMQADQDAQSATFIIGTSLAFEAVVLGLAALLFCRRDF